MRSYGILGALALGTLSIAAPAFAGVDLASGHDVTVVSQHDHSGRVVVLDEYAFEPSAGGLLQAHVTHDRRRSRGKRPQAKPCKHANRLHVSRRARRRHRRAA